MNTNNGKDESVSSSPPTSMASLHFPKPSTSSTMLREATIPESPDDEEAARETSPLPAGSVSPSMLPVPPLPTSMPPVMPPPVPKRDRSMSSAHLTMFLGSKAASARRSLSIKPLMDSLQVTPNAPQFLTVSPTFTARDRSRSPSPSSAFASGRRVERGSRHSIDVRNFPSYLQRKRTSLTFGASKMLESLVEGKVILTHSCRILL